MINIIMFAILGFILSIVAIVTIVLWVKNREGKFLWISGGSLGLIVVGFLSIMLPVMMFKQKPNTVGLKINTISHQITRSEGQGWHGKSPFEKMIYAPTNQIETNFGNGKLEANQDGYLHAQTKDSQYVAFAVNLKWRFKIERIEDIYKTRGTIDAKNVANNYLRPIVQKAIEKVAVTYNVREIMGGGDNNIEAVQAVAHGRNEFYAEVETKINELIDTDLYQILTFAFTDSDAGKKIEDAIMKEGEAKIQISIAQKEREQAEVKAEQEKAVQLIKANQDKEVAVVQKEKELAIAQQNIQIEASQARADLLANPVAVQYIIASGFNPSSATDDQIKQALTGHEDDVKDYIRYNTFMEKWNGEYPQTLLSGGSNQLPQVILDVN